ncbi:hypothetical protein BSQ39_05405 [Loigolactobacillus backii]|uniref:VOC family protein n=1 Tax=Loigolactobacillus backii TaxID=375175 RepID=UPI000C1C98BF|nr:glyoxalase/bleomycin resistance/extradiol dioxygenase family protein [Loigolactobacillus backii]PIO83049.1 hypothetical protein BSQ39_05405 [Loigolactobacillus backii]
MTAHSAIYPYLTFANTKEALAYYQTVFDAQDIVRLPVTTAMAQAMQVPSEVDFSQLTMHAAFTILGEWLYAADNFEQNQQLTNSTRLLLDIDSDDAQKLATAQALYNRLTREPTIKIDMPLADQGWGAKLGMFTDKYQIQWMLQLRSWSRPNPGAN